MQVQTFPSVIMYIYMHSHLMSFLHSILCATAACITMPCLDIDTYIKKSSFLSSVHEE